MIVFIKVENGIIIQKQPAGPKIPEGFIEHDEKLNGAVICHQNYDLVSGVSSAPTLTAAQAKERSRQELKTTRLRALAAVTYEFEDGRKVQASGDDLPAFEGAIKRGISKRWTMADNSVAWLTIAEMAGALAYGLDQFEIIWDTFHDGVELL